MKYKERDIIPLRERLEAYISPEPNTGCWLWTGATDRGGYGRIGSGRRGRGTLLAHRAMYEIDKGPIPDGLGLDHLCRVRCCVNPAHLDPTTTGENARRAAGLGTMGQAGRKKTHCPQGHEYTPENTYLYLGKHRKCKTCRLAADRRHRAKPL